KRHHQGAQPDPPYEGFEMHAHRPGIVVQRLTFSDIEIAEEADIQCDFGHYTSGGEVASLLRQHVGKCFAILADGDHSFFSNISGAADLTNIHQYKGVVLDLQWNINFHT